MCTKIGQNDIGVCALKLVKMIRSVCTKIGQNDIGVCALILVKSIGVCAL